MPRTGKALALTRRALYPRTPKAYTPLDPFSVEIVQVPPV